MQLCAVEYGHRVYNEPRAHFGQLIGGASMKVVVNTPDGNKNQLGGTMRLGVCEIVLRSPNCVAVCLYGERPLYEVHQQRNKVNPYVVPCLEGKHGIRVVGSDKFGNFMNILYSTNHPCFAETQFHPEFLRSSSATHVPKRESSSPKQSSRKNAERKATIVVPTIGGCGIVVERRRFPFIDAHDTPEKC